MITPLPFSSVKFHTFTLFIILLFTYSNQFCFNFNYNNENNGPLVVTHNERYNGTGGKIILTVGINPASKISNLSTFRTPILNNILIWNLQIATIDNTKQLADPNKYDIESVTLHEFGHALGLAHNNLGTESGLSSPMIDSTAAYKGGNGKNDVDAGGDGVFGSSDDIRGDDVNYFYFNPSNNPFVLSLPVDKKTYKNDISFLPKGNSFASTGGLAESSLLNISKRNIEEEDINNYFAPVHLFTFANNEEDDKLIKSKQGAVGKIDKHDLCIETMRTRRDHFDKRARTGTTEAVMQQGTYNGEYQRTLTADDVAAIAYARLGSDEIYGTSDDYSFTLTYKGETTGNDIDVYLDPNYTGLGVTSAAGLLITGFHYQTLNATILINPNINWFYNPKLVTLLLFSPSQNQSISTSDLMKIDVYFASSGPSSLSPSHFNFTSSNGGSIKSLNKIESNHFTVTISGFSSEGTPCIFLSSTTLNDTRFGTPYDPSNRLCFTVKQSSNSTSSKTPSPSTPKSSSTSSHSITRSPTKKISSSVSKTNSPSTSKYPSSTRKPPSPSRSPSSKVKSQTPSKSTKGTSQSTSKSSSKSPTKTRLPSSKSPTKSHTRTLSSVQALNKENSITKLDQNNDNEQILYEIQERNIIIGFEENKSNSRVNSRLLILFTFLLLLLL